ncbi:hypothetical protein AB0F43_24140 [Kribbella sp. NPDC023972]|uniref:hypothetical protein n=1 Tax=Kribbella sp. NPDC023972 TaxID=3154795 RepID=UPI0033F691B1
MSTTNWATEACTLPTADQPLRVAEFDALFAEHLKGAARVNPTTLDLSLAAEAHASAADLTARETECCSFFRFELTPLGDDRLRLRIGVPPAHVGVLDALSARLPR